MQEWETSKISSAN